MAKQTTHQAVKRLLFDEDYLLLWLRSGYTKDYRRKLRYKFRKKELSDKIQEELLSQCGYEVVIEKAWNEPKLPAF